MLPWGPRIRRPGAARSRGRPRTRPAAGPGRRGESALTAVTVPASAALTGRLPASKASQGCSALYGWMSDPPQGMESAVFPDTFRKTSADSGMIWRTKVSSPMESSRLMCMVRARSMPSAAFCAQGWRRLPRASMPNSSAQAMALLRSKRSPRVVVGFDLRCRRFLRQDVGGSPSAALGLNWVWMRSVLFSDIKNPSRRERLCGEEFFMRNGNLSVRELLICRGATNQ